MNSNRGPIPDLDDRRRALDVERSCIVQAPAGSGKTELLIQRILALLGTVERPDEVLAITFTRKAAGEMRDRLLRALESAAVPAPAEEHARTTWQLARAVVANDERRQWRLRDNPVQLSIQTIDSFCASLVRRMPWLSRFGAQAAIVDDAEELYREAAEKVLDLADGTDACAQAACLLLGHLDNRMERLRNLLVGMLGRRDQWLRHLYGQAADQQRTTLEKGLRSLAEGFLEQLDCALSEEHKCELLRLGTFAADNLPNSAHNHGIAALQDQTQFPAPVVEDIARWRALADLLLTGGGSLRKRLDKNCGFPPGNRQPFADMKLAMSALLEELAPRRDLVRLFNEIRSLPSVLYEEDQWRVLQALTTLLPRAVAELWLVFKQRGQCDFVQVALAAVQALGGSQEPSELLLRLDSRIRHILVDEFQDTSFGQFLLLQKLTEGWQAQEGRTLFLVGDPMQSIYRFREAEVGLYLQARQQGIGSLRLEPLTLSANFRSQRGIVDWFNQVFPELFPDQEDAALGGVTYAPSIAAREALAAPAVTCHPAVGRDDEAEALKVLELVCRAREENPQGSVAVLVRARSHLTAILEAFRSAGLRFKAQEIDFLGARPVALDLQALTRALLHPADRVATLAVLRAPWCGLNLADLHALFGAADDLSLVELMRQPRRLFYLSDLGRNNLERLLAVFRHSLAQRGRVSLRERVEGAWLALGGPCCVNEAGLTDADGFFALLEGLDQGGDLLPFESLAEKLAVLYAAPDPLADDSLQVMTIHKAKGLEFDTVILPGLGRRPPAEKPVLMRWLELPKIGLLLAPLAPAGSRLRDGIYDLIGRIEKQKTDLELSRVLYVAATRAKNRLHLLGHAQPSNDEQPRPEKGSFLEKLWPAFASVYSQVEGAQASTEQALPPGVLLRRLPEGWLPPQLPAGCAEDSGDPLRPSAVTEQEGDGSLHPHTDEGRHIGTLLHQILEQMVREGTTAWDDDLLALQVPAWSHALSQRGVALCRLEEAVARVRLALKTVIRGERGRWLLARHRQGDCELALSGVLDGQLVHAVIDRTFIDDEGTRWIIDYKTSVPRQGNLKDFLSQEGERYRRQMTIYRRLFRELEPEASIRAALYFPLLDGWFEYEH